jgi:hypothetical protein
MPRQTRELAVTGDELLALLGKRRGSREFKSIEHRLREKAKVSTHHSQRYASFEKNNISLNLGPGGIIDSLFIAACSTVSLPTGLLRSHSRQEVQKLLGRPAFSRERQEFVGAIGPGDVFDFPDMTLAIDFSHDGNAIDKVCAMTPGAAPGRDEREQARRRAGLRNRLA